MNYTAYCTDCDSPTLVGGAYMTNDDICRHCESEKLIPGCTACQKLPAWPGSDECEQCMARGYMEYAPDLQAAAGEPNSDERREFLKEMPIAASRCGVDISSRIHSCKHCEELVTDPAWIPSGDYSHQPAHLHCLLSKEPNKLAAVEHTIRMARADAAAETAHSMAERYNLEKQV